MELPARAPEFWLHHRARSRHWVALSYIRPKSVLPGADTLRIDNHMDYLRGHVPTSVLGVNDTHCRGCYYSHAERQINGSSPVGTRFGESRLAWSLAETAGPFLESDQRNEMFVAVGVGDTFTAICLALNAISRADCSIEGLIATRLNVWLDAYIGHDDEPKLRRLLRQVIGTRVETDSAQ